MKISFKVVFMSFVLIAPLSAKNKAEERLERTLCGGVVKEQVYAVGFFSKRYIDDLFQEKDALEQEVLSSSETAKLVNLQASESHYRAFRDQLVSAYLGVEVADVENISEDRLNDLFCHIMNSNYKANEVGLHATIITLQVCKENNIKDAQSIFELSQKIVKSELQNYRRNQSYVWAVSDFFAR